MKKICIVLWFTVILFFLTACGEDNGQAGALIPGAMQGWDILMI